MKIVEVQAISKSFRGTKVVNDVSFDIESGEIFGMVGPNGAGKTTTIRMLMDILKPDEGDIKILGGPIVDSTKNRIGYLPEERGLYKKLSVSDSLSYMAALKNMKRQPAEQAAGELLKRVNMYPHRQKKTEELSHGMGQLVQFVATILHRPELVVLDEPFVALDPLNTQLLKDLIIELKKQGKTVILSTHMMNQVEELCDRVMMINQGKAVLYGSLADIKSKYRNKSVFIDCDCLPTPLTGVTDRVDHGKYIELFLDDKTPPQTLLRDLLEKGATVNRFEISTPSLNEVFIQVVKEGQR